MSWFDRPERRQVVDFPEGRDYRCEADGCDGRKPEAEGGQPFGCPECGGPMSRIVVQL